MKKGKFTIIGCILMSVLYLMGIVACGSNKEVSKIDTMSNAKMPAFGSVDELEEAATLILRVEKTENEKNVALKLSGPDMYHGYTISQVKVKEIIKNTSGKEISLQDEIPVLENQFTYVDSQKRQVTCHMNRYKMMEYGNEYYLYMHYSEHDGWWVILSGLLGKVPVSLEEDILFPASKITTYNRGTDIEQTTLEKLVEKLRIESIEKYN